MDTDIEELKEELRIQRKLLEDTNATVRKMHRGAVWGRIISWGWWIAVLVLTTAVYYYFLGPYMNQLLQIYTGFSGGSGDSGGLLQTLLKQYGL
ncbi:hypothetical protein KW798_03090 [Candidatus Parcubacteria bacterium]|nr:hypothetical protein [Candidatus Parcubacteria bacterium]